MEAESKSVGNKQQEINLSVKRMEEDQDPVVGSSSATHFFLFQESFFKDKGKLFSAIQSFPRISISSFSRFYVSSASVLLMCKLCKAPAFGV